MIEVKHLVKQYGDHFAVSDLSFHLGKGKIYGLLGPNGAGKSTTMNMLTGYIAPTSGTILIDGHDTLTESEEARKCIGYLPDNPPLYMDLTVREYLLTVSQLKRIPKAQQREMIDTVMETTGLCAMQNRLIRNLSKGYRQRTGIAQALIGFPQIIILDEPTVGLDPGQILEIRALVKRLGEEHTVIFSSHILPEVSAICDYILILNKGRLSAQGTALELEEMFFERQRIEFLLDGREEDARNAVSLVRDAEILSLSADASESNLLRLVVEMKAEGDFRRPLSEALFRNGLIVMEMKKMTASLEDVFLRLTERKETANDGGL